MSRFLFCLLFCLPGSLQASDPCANSARPFWASICADTQLLALAGEVEHLQDTVRQRWSTTPAKLAVFTIRQAGYFDVRKDECVGTPDQMMCLKAVLMENIWELVTRHQLTPSEMQISSGPFTIFCPTFAAPLSLVLADTTPQTGWLQFFDARFLLEADETKGGQVFKGRTVGLRLLDGNKVSLSGVSNPDDTCWISD